MVLEIKPCGLVSRIRDVEAFCYKKNQNNLLCAIVFDFVDCVVFEISKIEGPGKPLPSNTIRHNHTWPHFFSEVGG